jgi:hypothetical protein
VPPPVNLCKVFYWGRLGLDLGGGCSKSCAVGQVKNGGLPQLFFGWLVLWAKTKADPPPTAKDDN